MSESMIEMVGKIERYPARTMADDMLDLTGRKIGDQFYAADIGAKPGGEYMFFENCRFAALSKPVGG